GQDFAGARPFLEEAAAMARGLARGPEGPLLLRQAIERLACAIADSGDFSSARPLFDEAIAIARAEGDERGRAYVQLSRANASRDGGDLERARQDFEEALGVLEGLG